MRRLSLALFVLSALAPSDTRAYCRMTTSNAAPAAPTDCITEGVPLAWKRRCTSYSLDASGSPDLSFSDLRAIMDASFDAWTSVTCPGGSPGLAVEETAQVAICQDAEYRSNDGNVNVVAFVDDWPDRMYPTSAYAVTTVWHNTDTGEIYDVDMLVNQRLAPYGECPPIVGCGPGNNPVVVDLANVMTHEVGHFFGIAHSSEPEATMYYLAPRGEVSKRTLAPDDIAALCAIYPPGALPSSCDFTPRHGFDPDCVDESSRKGRGCGTAPGAEAGPIVPLAVAVLAVVVHRRRRRAR